MKKLLIIGFLFLTGCGYSSVNNETIGQVKTMTNHNPIFCSNWDMVDLSLGVMRNGTGSMSKEDQTFTVTDKDQLKLLKEAAQTGQLVKVTYNRKRFSWCVDEDIIQNVEIVK